MRLLLVRHGQSDWNALGRLQGQADIGLTALGRRQADALRPVIEAISPHRAIASDLRRVRETAKRIGTPSPVFTAGLRELDLGDWTGRSIDELMISNAAAYAAFNRRAYTPPSGEDWCAFAARVSSAVECERAARPGQSLLVVCHAGVISALIEHYLAIEPEQIVSVAPASLTIIRLRAHGQPKGRLELFNYRPSAIMHDGSTDPVSRP